MTYSRQTAVQSDDGDEEEVPDEKEEEETDSSVIDPDDGFEYEQSEQENNELILRFGKELLE